ncbi:hypothetical protein TNIN_315291 [Trichonephila inaurata madagascariensis]|uniref:Uncharacterized protein n=1 Tax=Trichonephila inaurata madagascariensis TaxID=2747483 RepID=A0A8X6MIN9_9ARAC|nr:hypothetical protein TNIN_315291 [Trichonephila inaurata madagascariensis]
MLVFAHPTSPQRLWKPRRDSRRTMHATWDLNCCQNCPVASSAKGCGGKCGPLAPSLTQFPEDTPGDETIPLACHSEEKYIDIFLSSVFVKNECVSPW